MDVEIYIPEGADIKVASNAKQMKNMLNKNN